MMRWSIVAIVLALLAAALLGTYHYDELSRVQAIEDELLAYEITPAQGVMVDVPAGVPSVQATTWAVLPSDGRLAEGSGLSYTLEVKLWPHAEREPLVRRYSAITRVSAVRQPKRQGQGTLAGLADGDAWLSDPRTLEVDTASVAARGGRMQVRVIPAQYQQLLVRLSYRFLRGELERALLRENLEPAQAHQLLGETTALGFVDLSPRARDLALSYWGRRLTAIGRLGHDYLMRRVLVGAQENLGQSEQRSMAFDMAPHRHAAFNFTGPVQLELFGPPGLRLLAFDGAALVYGLRARLADDKRALLGTERSVVLNDEGRARLVLSQAALRTVVLAPEQPAQVRFRVPARHGAAQLGDLEQRSLPDAKLEIAPDVRHVPYYQLDSSEGVRFGVVPGQGPLRLSLRAARPAPFDADETWRARLWASWSDVRDPATARADREEVAIEVQASDFDDFGEVGTASDARVVFFAPPPGVDEVVLHGDPHLAVSAGVREPGIEASELEEPYRVSLAPDQRLVHAPLSRSRLARVEPDNLDELIVAGRQWILRGQVRLVTGGLTDEKRPERGLWPRGRPLRRQLWVQRLMQEGDGVASGDIGSVWFELGAQARVRVPRNPTGPSAIDLRFEVAPEQLGQTLRVQVDGSPRAQLPLVVAASSLQLPIAPGVHRLVVEGLGEDGVLYGDARPLSAVEALRAYSVFEIGRDGTLEIPITRVSDEPLTLVLFVVTEGRDVPWQVLYSIEGGAAQRRAKAFFREHTELTGVLEGVSGDYETGLLWEAPRERPRRVSQGSDGVSKTRIRLGDDLWSRKCLVKLRLPDSRGGPERLWVRAVLVGQADAVRADQARQWTREERDEF